MNLQHLSGSLEGARGSFFCRVEMLRVLCVNRFISKPLANLDDEIMATDDSDADGQAINASITTLSDDHES
ncbi:unnamed protein product [Schistocephalus solidus]|uniref:Uncharacterized protein n=1 Tax=Schistocephalus solidus TaxID=70667 RepID=A0A183TKR7_SCHSO|nr:unnamed protein product [Schistocephalus solidus]